MGIFFEFLVCRLLSCCTHCWIEGRYLVAFEDHTCVEVFRHLQRLWTLQGYGLIEMFNGVVIVQQGFLGQVQVRMLDSGTVIQSISGALPWQRLAPPTSGMCQRRRMLMLRD